MCMFYNDFDATADTEAIADRLKQEFDVQLEALPPSMSRLLLMLPHDDPAD